MRLPAAGKQLAKWADPPVQEAIDAGVVPIAHHYLTGEDEKLQFEVRAGRESVGGPSHDTKLKAIDRYD